MCVPRSLAIAAGLSVWQMNAFREACVTCMRSQVAPVRLLRKGSSDAEFGYKYFLLGSLWIYSNTEI